MQKGVLGSALLLVMVASSTAAGEATRPLSKAVFLDKCRGAWAGQMIGVAYGAPYEFRFMGKIQDEPIRPWSPHHICNGFDQDDLYVELIWLDALQEHGLDITYEQAGKAFAATTHGLAHANLVGRENVRRGIMPPMSGHPENTRHADDIDFQIEADLFGIITPGMARESNRLCDVFGHIMNYGDGVYGGMFVAGMYSAAYYEDRDIEGVIRSGLACIPSESQYHQCISDVIRWYHDEPQDWRAVWQKLEDKWQDDIDCVPGHPFNIDAKINGAYIVMGLLYGQGNLERTLRVSTLCGQDNDCNPSNSAGVLGCMQGYSAIPFKYIERLEGEAGRRYFAGSYRTFGDVVTASRQLAEKLILRVGGDIGNNVYFIPVQEAVPAKLEQWEDQMKLLEIAIPQWEVERWDPSWTVESCGYEMGPGYLPDFAGRQHVLLLVPKRDGPAVMKAEIGVPDIDAPAMHIPISSFGTEGDWIGDFRLRVLIGDELEFDEQIRTLGRFEMRKIDLGARRGETIRVRIEVHQEGKYHWERAYFGRIELKAASSD